MHNHNIFAEKHFKSRYATELIGS